MNSSEFSGEATPNEAGLLQDARAARMRLAKRADVREQDIVLMGRSLGGNHNDPQTEEYRVAFDEFIDSLP